MTKRMEINHLAKVEEANKTVEEAEQSRGSHEVEYNFNNFDKVMDWEV